MHEVGLMQEAVRIALTNAERSGATRIHALTLRIGPLAGVEMEALRLAFDVVTPNTPAEGAMLHLDEVSVTCWCMECECLFQPGASVFRCPRCSRLSADVRQGREFDLVAMEVT